MKPKISIPGLILAIAITVGVIVFAATMLIRNKSIEDKPARHSNTIKQAHPEAEVEMPPGYSEAIKEGFLRLNGLTTKQVIEAVSQYHHIPVVYYSTKLASEDDKQFSGEINLEDSVKNIITMLNRLDFYVSYDGKNIIAGK